MHARVFNILIIAHGAQSLRRRPQGDRRKQACKGRARFAALPQLVLLDIVTRVSTRDAARAMGACRALAVAVRSMPEIDLVLGKNYTCTDDDDDDDDEAPEPAEPRGRAQKRRRGAAGAPAQVCLLLSHPAVTLHHDSMSRRFVAHPFPQHTYRAHASKPGV